MASETGQRINEMLAELEKELVYTPPAPAFSRHESLVLCLGSVEGMMARIPTEMEAYRAGIDSGQVFEVLVSLSEIQDNIRSLLIADSPCPTCNGQGGWLAGCPGGPSGDEFGESVDIECSFCDGRGWMYKG